MPAEEDLRAKLWKIWVGVANSDRINGNEDPSTALLEILRRDFQSSGPLLSRQEYQSPKFREAIIAILSRQTRVGLFSAPSEIVHFTRDLLDVGDRSVLSLYCGLGEFLWSSAQGIGVELNSGVAAWASFLAKVSGKKLKIVNQNPLEWESAGLFERIICQPPWLTGPNELKVLDKAISLLKKDGRLAVIMPAGFLWKKNLKHVRADILARCNVSAVISLPVGIWRATQISAALLIITNSAPGKTYMAMSRSVSDLGAILDDYWVWSLEKRASVGFWTELEEESWDPSRSEPIDFNLGDVSFQYRMVPLQDLAKITPGKPLPESKIAVNRTGSKIVWTADEQSLKPQNNIFVSPSPDVSAQYLQLYMKSNLGRRALTRLVKGTAIPHVSAADLSGLPVVLPDRATQQQVVLDASELRRKVDELQALAEEGRQALQDSLFNLEPIKKKFAYFSQNTEKAFNERLPFPIALVYRKLANAPNATQRFSCAIELFEVAVRFVVLVQLAELSRHQPSILEEAVPGLKKLKSPALGDWVSMFRTIHKAKKTSKEGHFLSEIADFNISRYERTLNEIPEARNSSLRGHGTTLSEEEYVRDVEGIAPRIYDLVSALLFLTNYELLKPSAMTKEGDFFHIPVQMLMGDNPHFDQVMKVLRAPLETNRVLYLNPKNESLNLDPFIVLDCCPQCKRTELLMLDKVVGKKITYLSYESGHRPVIESGDRLPPAIKQALSEDILH
jgi:hypothetical protein